MDLKDFNKKKQVILQYYQQLERISTGLAATEIKSVLNDSMPILEKDAFNLVVVGEFSRGKSTFINAILGRRILPSSTKPTTTVINKISYHDTPEYKLYFREGGERTISEDEFKDIVARRDPDMDDPEEVEAFDKNMAYISTIAYADIKYPAALCQGDIEVIDTPGTNDLDQAREEITFKFIPQSDVAIMVLSANQILSKSEVLFLKERILSNDIQKVFFAINFKDRLATPGEEQKVMEYAYNHLKEIIDQPKIYMVSSKNALNYKRTQKGETVKGTIPATLEETGFSQLEREVGAYLMEERASLKLGKYMERGMKLADQLIENHLSLQLGSLGMKTKELEEKVNSLRPKVQEARQIAREECNRLRSRLSTIESDLVFQYRTGLETICMTANAVVNRYAGDLEIEKITRAIEHEVAPLQNKLHQELQLFKQNYIERELNRSLNRLSKIGYEMQTETSKMLRVVQPHNMLIQQLGNVYVGEPVNENINLLESLMVGGAVVGLFTMPHIVIPAAIFGGKHMSNFFASKRRENFLMELKLQVDKRYGEIIPQQIRLFEIEYRRSMETLIEQVETGVNGRLDSLEEQLNSLLQNKQKTEQEERAEYARLMGIKQEIENIKLGLKGV